MGDESKLVPRGGGVSFIHKNNMKRVVKGNTYNIRCKPFLSYGPLKNSIQINECICHLLTVYSIDT